MPRNWSPCSSEKQYQNLVDSNKELDKRIQELNTWIENATQQVTNYNISNKKILADPQSGTDNISGLLGEGEDHESLNEIFRPGKDTFASTSF